MLKIDTRIHAFRVKQPVRFKLHDQVFVVEAVSGADTYVISAGFGKTLTDVPGHLLEPAEAAIVQLARKVA